MCLFVVSREDFQSRAFSISLPLLWGPTKQFGVATESREVRVLGIHTKERNRKSGVDPERKRESKEARLKVVGGAGGRSPGGRREGGKRSCMISRSSGIL